MGDRATLSTPTDRPTLPDYGGACIDQVVAAAVRSGPYGGPAPPPAWLP